MDNQVPQELIHTLGTLFGESQAIDRNIVEKSQYLHGTSNGVKQTLENTIRLINNNGIRQGVLQPPQPPQPVVERSYVDTVNTASLPAVYPYPQEHLPTQQQAQHIYLEVVLGSIDQKLTTIIEILTKKKNAYKPRKRKPRKISTES